MSFLWASPLTTFTLTRERNRNSLFIKLNNSYHIVMSASSIKRVDLSRHKLWQVFRRCLLLANKFNRHLMIKMHSLFLCGFRFTSYRNSFCPVHGVFLSNLLEIYWQFISNLFAAYLSWRSRWFHQFRFARYTVLTSPNNYETAVHGCNPSLSVLVVLEPRKDNCFT